MRPHATPRRASASRSAGCGGSRSTQATPGARTVVGAPAPGRREVPVPASYNDLFADIAVRDHVGDAWYQTDVRVPARWAGERIVLRFDSATHRAVVWVNGTQVAEHEGGYTPFEADVTDVVRARAPSNRITVVVNNVLTWQSIPPGLVDDGPTGAASATSTTSSTTPASIGRSGCTPRRGRTSRDVTVVTGLDGADGAVRYRVDAAADGLEVRVVLRDAEGAEVARATGGDGELDGRGRAPVAPRRGLPLRARRRAVGRRRRAGRRLRAAGRHPHRAGRRDALPDQRRAVLLQRLRQARGHRRARQGARRRVHGPRLRADGVARRELVPHVALPVRRGGARLRRPPRHRGDRRDRGRGPEHGPGRRCLRHAGLRDVLRGHDQRRHAARSTARRSRS